MQRRPRGEGEHPSGGDASLVVERPRHRGQAALPLTEAGPEAGVPLDALHVAVTLGDGVLDVFQGHVLAWAEEGLAHRSALPRASPARCPESIASRADPGRAPSPATHTSCTEVRPSASAIGAKVSSAG